MGLYNVISGRILSAHIRAVYNLFKGVADGGDDLVLGSDSTLDMSAVDKDGFKLPTAAGAAPTEAGALAYDSTTKRLKWGDGAETVDPFDTAAGHNHDGVNSRMVVGGVLPTVAIDASDSPYTLESWGVHLDVDATDGAVTVNLPTAVGNDGAMIEVRKSDDSANAVTVDGHGDETINGAANLQIAGQDDSYSLRSNNVNVRIV